MDAGRGACGAGFKSLLHRYAQHCHSRIVTIYTYNHVLTGRVRVGTGKKNRLNTENSVSRRHLLVFRYSFSTIIRFNRPIIS